MSVFDIGLANGAQSAATTVATSLVPKKHASLAADLKSLGADTLTAKAATTSGSGSSAAAADPGTITSNDFLTLLVSELKHQDPTQPTDPNAYITQLVNVNSLQQLISINQGITSISGPAKTTAPVVWRRLDKVWQGAGPSRTGAMGTGWQGADVLCDFEQHQPKDSRRVDDA